MAYSFISVIVVLTYILFVYFDSFAIHARYSAVIEKNIPMGITLQNSIGSINRFIGVLIAPQVAFLVEYGANLNHIFIVAFTCFSIGGFFTLLSFKCHIYIFSKLRCVVRNFSDDKYKLSYFFTSKTLPESGRRYSFKDYNLKIVMVSSWIGAGYYGACFYMALLSFEYVNYRATIFQLAAVFTGVGTVLLSFYLNPTLTEMEISNDYQRAYNSLMIGRILGTSIIPLVLLTLIYLYVN
jgi:hypothetical protein